jgi:hypothetical protein
MSKLAGPRLKATRFFRDSFARLRLPLHSVGLVDATGERLLFSTLAVRGGAVSGGALYSFHDLHARLPNRVAVGGKTRGIELLGSLGVGETIAQRAARLWGAGRRALNDHHIRFLACELV